MRKRMWMSLSQLQKLDRAPLTRRTFSLAKHLENGGTVPPIHIQYDSHGLWRVLDGRHRVIAHKLVGCRHILVRFGVDGRVPHRSVKGGDL